MGTSEGQSVATPLLLLSLLLSFSRSSQRRSIAVATDVAVVWCAADRWAGGKKTSKVT